MSVKSIIVMAKSYSGANQHGRNLAAFISDRCRGFRGEYFDTTAVETLRAAWSLNRAYALIVFGGPAPPILVRMVARALRIPVIIFWGGSDVTTALQNPARTNRLLMARARHFAVSPWLADELASLGLVADIVKVANVTAPSPLPHLPAAFTIMAYLPAPRRLFYGLERIIRIARHYPDTKILIVGRGGGDPEAPPNMRYLGHVPVDEVYRQATVLVRLCDHDGMANMVVEALALGRYCIWNYAIPGVIRVDDADSAIDAIGALKSAHEAGALELNRDGSRHATRRFCPSAVADELITLIEKSAQDGPAR